MKLTRELLKQYPVLFLYADGRLRLSYPSGRVIFYNTTFNEWCKSHVTHKTLIGFTTPKTIEVLK